MNKNLRIPAVALLGIALTFQNCGKIEIQDQAGQTTGGANLGSSNPAADPLAPLNASVFDGSMAANNEISFEIKLNKAHSMDLQVNWQTENGTALAGSNFTNTMMSTTIPAGSLGVVLKIPILKSEATATNFKIRILSISMGDIARAEAILTIPANSIVTVPVPFVNQWSAISNSGLVARDSNSAVWTGSKMIVWGGRGAAPAGVDGNVFFNDGAEYDPATNTWASMNIVGAPIPRSHHVAAWTGTKMIVWGGFSLAVNGTVYHDTGGVYDPATKTWTAMSMTGAPSGRWSHTAVWTGTKLIVWGGVGANSVNTNTGAIYDPATNTWQAMSTTNAPTSRSYQRAIWTGTRMIVWGGMVGAGFDRSPTNTGGIYDPATNTWIATSTTGAPQGRNEPSMVWTGTEMIVWGGTGVQGIGAIRLNTGGRFNPATNTWQTTSTANAPVIRMGQSTVWTGTKMIVWGGYGGGSPETYLATGGIYDPALNTWQATATTGALSARSTATTVWTGSKMIIWGGVLYSNTGGILQ